MRTFNNAGHPLLHSTAYPKKDLRRNALSTMDKSHQPQKMGIAEAVEHFLNEKLNPVYRFHYALWVYWWPLWRGLYSRQAILRLWDKYNLVNEGQILLDYGCGTGDFTIPAAKIVGSTGRVYALDCFARQLKIVKTKTHKEGLSNIEVIHSDLKTGLPNEHVDIIWMCDVFHEVRQKRAVLEEMHRVLTKDGILAIYDSMKDRVLYYTEGLFSLNGRDGNLFWFVKAKQKLSVF